VLSDKVTAGIRNNSSRSASSLLLFLALAAFCTALIAVDIAPESGGPGVTCDEFYHISYGKRLVASFLVHGRDFFRPTCIQETFAWRKGGPPVHPPLGNWILGWANWLFDPEPLNPARIAVTPARLGTAICFGCLALIVGLFSSAYFGRIGGIGAVVSLICMPRLFGHGHLAALDLITALTCTGAIVTILWAERYRLWHHSVIAGAVWGLALLTRFHGVLCAPPIVCYMLLRHRQRALLPLVFWLSSGLAVFFLGWPWLWLDPVGHIQQYFVSSTERIHIHTFYLGRVWDDTVVPWHYPWVMFLITLPVGLVFLGVLGILSLFSDQQTLSGSQEVGMGTSTASNWLVLGTICFFLIVFSVPGVPVYDGVRLFLPVYPLWAILVGKGTSLFWRTLSRMLNRLIALRMSIICLFFALQGIGTFWFRPVWLSYYNCLVGGLFGAEKLGFEINYWGDALTEPILCEAANRLGVGESLAFTPSLAPYQAAGIVAASPCLAEQEVLLKGWSPELGSEPVKAHPQWLLLYRRRADLPDDLSHILQEQPVTEISRQGVWLARLIAVSENSTKPITTSKMPDSSQTDGD